MSRFRGPRLRIVRRLGKLPGLTNKSSNRSNPPGQHGSSVNKKRSQYSIRLREKQKLRFHYCISERQLFNYLKKARKRKGSSAIELLSILEMRLDNVVFSLGMSPTILSARQLISHRHLTVNSSIVNIPSFLCKKLDVIGVRNSISSQKVVNERLKLKRKHSIPAHLAFSAKRIEGRVTNYVYRRSIMLLINELLVIEFYSRKL